MKLRERVISGVTSSEVREYEIKHRAVARKAAASGMVLLKNEGNILPLETGSMIDLYGSGAIHHVKGGTGSGDVNEREVVSIREGMRNAGFVITNEKWLDEYEELYTKNRLEWRDDLLKRSKQDDSPGLFELHCANPMKRPIGADPVKTEAGIAMYVLSRIAGEGADRRKGKGDYLIDDDEYAFIKKLCNIYKSVILVVNTGGLIELSFVDDFANIDAIIQMVQPGMEGGNALADIISGKVTPSGKLTDSWAYSYEDYPGAAEYSKNGPTLDYALYKEGIYVGYRYFDTFHKAVRFGFGFGLSYTTFDIETLEVNVTGQHTINPEVSVKVRVTNKGNKYSGREVVQIYVSCPDGRLAKEYRRLTAFAKTSELAPGACEELEITFPLYSCASYDESVPGYILEDGYYGIWVGNSLGDSKLRGMIKIIADVVMVRTANICKLNRELEEIAVPNSKRETRYRSWVEKGKDKKLPIITILDTDIVTQTLEYGIKSKTPDAEALEFVNSLSMEEMIKLACGDPVKAQDSGDGVIGSGGVSVPGSAAETSRCCLDKGLGSMVLSDGPAGIRLDQDYFIDKTGAIHQRTFMEKVEGGIFMERELKPEDGDTVYYQFCTAFPVGTLLAQTWDPEIVAEVGTAVGEEMMEFQTALWLAPGMNIHRNPLCGRNFEYYSEDPVLSGIIAAAMTDGVQKIGGCGTTIKHFACNSQEENRLHCDSVLSERALREIYLKGFEICIKTAQPMAIMTSYNLVNGIHTANSYDLCSMAARDEWGFAGMIMTDWTTTEQGPDCTASGCMRAGNDLVCPGNIKDFDNLHAELESGELKEEDIRNCIARLVYTIWKSNAYEDAISYTSRFAELESFVDVKRI